MRFVHYFPVVLSIVCSAAISGCGDGNHGVQSTASAASLESSQGCIDCHSDVSSPVVATAKITEEWKSSNHNTSKSGRQYGAGCADCHEPENGHPGSCSRCHGGVPSAVNVTGSDIIRNPEEQLKCYKCHHARSLSAGHFNNYSTATYAEFVTKDNAAKCRNCHNPHDVTTLMSLNKDWAASGHGNTRSAAWSDRDFKTNTSCIRCHTATGFANFLKSEFTTPFPAQSWATAGDKSREVLSCDACHASYDFINSIRRTKPFVAPYNNNLDQKTFPDVGASNQCIACHSGRESMASILAMGTMSSASTATSGFKAPHNMVAAGIMYMTTGFTDFTDMTTKASDTYTYADSYTIYYGSGTVPAGNISSTHRKLGTSLINGDSHNAAAFVTGMYDTNGPCVTCHMNATGRPDRKTSHTFIVNANAFDQVCINCHSSSGATNLTGINFKTAFVDKKRVVFQNAVNLATKLLKDRYGITYNAAAYPYFFEANGSAVKNWKRGHSDNEAKRLMGACYNIHLLTKDPGAFIHGRSYARRLVYDTIDYLDNGIIDMSTGATALATYPLVYTKGLTANSSLTTASYAYLAGYNITTGVWNSPYERP